MQDCNIESAMSKTGENCDFMKIEEPPQLPKIEPKLSLLPSDHPLLHKFQQLLKECLLRKKEELTNEIDGMKHHIKLKEQRREEQGAKLYDMQQEIRHQNEQLEEYTQEIQEHMEHRQEQEEAVAQLKTEYEKKIVNSKDQKNLYNKRMVDLEYIQQLENTIQKWTYEMEDEVKNAKRILSRDAQLQQQVSEEKKKADLLFLHLNTAVKEREKELETIQDELSEMKNIIDILNNSISAANIDLEVLQNEHKRLNQAWKEIIISISHRDKIKHEVQEAIEKEKEFYKLCSFGIEAIKKQIANEFRQNEKLETFKTRLLNDFATLKKECQKEAETLVTLENKLEQIPLWLAQTEKDLNEAKREGNILETEIRRILWKLDKKYNYKFEIEEEILKLAQKQLITDKASEYRLKLLRSAQSHRRGMELVLAQSQNILAETLLDIERCKGLLFKSREENTILQNKLQGIESECDRVEMELKSIETQLDIKMKRIDKLSGQLDNLLRSTEGADISPTELKIRQLEKVLQAAEQQIRQHQQFWLMLQNHFVNLSQKRNNQLNEIQVTNKQISIIKQKSLKIDNDLITSEQLANELNRDIQIYTHKLELLNEKMFRKREQHDKVENECELEHFQLVQRLKDNEMQVLNLESEVNEIQIEIEHFKDIVLNKHRVSLSWETKYKLIEEILQWRKQEHKLDSVIGTMKSEIRRMEIRYYQLKRAQEKLIKDLEHCVMHREQIFVAVSTKRRMDIKSYCSKATTIKQNIQDFRNKLKQIQSEIGILTDQQLIDISNYQEQIQKSIKELSANIERQTGQNLLIRQEIEQCILLKHLNLENIVHKQNRAKSYRKLKASAQPSKILRSVNTIGMQAQKQNELNDNLIDIVQSLIANFSEKKIFFKKLLQILKD